jgi:hypothetical protein
MTTNTVAWPLETRKTRTWARGGCHVGVPDIERQSDQCRGQCCNLRGLMTWWWCSSLLKVLYQARCNGDGHQRNATSWLHIQYQAQYHKAMLSVVNIGKEGKPRGKSSIVKISNTPPLLPFNPPNDSFGTPSAPSHEMKRVDPPISSALRDMCV